MLSPDTVVFDVDHTLTPQDSWTALTAALGASVHAHLALYEAYKNGDLSYSDSKAGLLSLWQATGQATRRRIRQVFRDLPIQEDAAPLVSWLAQRGVRICLISGSMDLYCEVVADRLGVHYWYANTRLLFDEEENLVDLDYVLDQENRKLFQLKEFCAQNDVDLTRVVVVGDGANDRRLFEYTRNGVLVGHRADPSVRRVARWRMTGLRELHDTLRVEQNRHSAPRPR